jgi:hypothetical protein
MRIQPTLSLLAAALSLSALAVSPAASAATAGTAISSVHVSAGAAYKPRPIEFEGVQGSYALSDGRTLRLSSAHGKLYAELGHARIEMMPVAPNVFATRDGMRLAFDRTPFATEVTLASSAAR